MSWLDFLLIIMVINRYTSPKKWMTDRSLSIKLYDVIDKMGVSEKIRKLSRHKGSCKKNIHKQQKKSPGCVFFLEFSEKNVICRFPRKIIIFRAFSSISFKSSIKNQWETIKAHLETGCRIWSILSHGHDKDQHNYIRQLRLLLAIIHF